MLIGTTNELIKNVEKIVDEVKVTDIHTHLFTPDFGSLLLWGVDELITYHYLIAETMRFSDISYKKFWSMSKQEQADYIWDTLFIKNSPYSEACRGILTVLSKLGMDVSRRDLNYYRAYFKGMKIEDYIDKALEVSGVSTLIMTNDPFEESERMVWLGSYKGDGRFKAALRIDSLLNAWPDNYKKLKEWGYDVSLDLTEKTLKEIRRFLSEWIDRMDALYMAASLPPTFVVPEDSYRSRIIEECIIPVSLEKDKPFAMMIGVKKLVNPDLKLAGDSVGKGDVNTIEYLCAKYPRNKFLVTMLSRENQHELCIAARKFRNLLIFGCWWFLNNPSLIDEMTRMRFELLGSSIIPQHSDSRVLDQLIYKWTHSRIIIKNVLIDKYCDLFATGWRIEDNEIRRDIEKLFGGTFWDFCKMKF